MSAGFISLEMNLLPGDDNRAHAKAKKNASPPIRGLAHIFVSGGAFTENIDLYAEPFPLVA